MRELLVGIGASTLGFDIFANAGNTFVGNGNSNGNVIILHTSGLGREATNNIGK